MKPQPEASKQEVLAGLVEGAIMTYHNAKMASASCALRRGAIGTS